MSSLREFAVSVARALVIGSVCALAGVWSVFGVVEVLRGDTRRAVVALAAAATCLAVARVASWLWPASRGASASAGALCQDCDAYGEVFYVGYPTAPRWLCGRCANGAGRVG